MVRIRTSLKRYCSMDLSFRAQLEYKFILKLADAFEPGDVEGFTNSVVEFDLFSTVDPWITALLLRANDLTGIPPQRINHPITLRMRQSIVQQPYDSTLPMYSNSALASSSFLHGSGGIPFSQHSRIGDSGSSGSTESAETEFTNHAAVIMGSLPYGHRHGLQGDNFMNSFPSTPILADNFDNDNLGFGADRFDEKSSKDTE
ncbi:hypothetical protein HK100_005496 [Physocladia obscura]|uniref:Uncharacterized protein n=1 Tax=Physocladia obscura TaxID=109957 RepID=A0AAD5T6I7_9FUNG|nr:hypothetical protein HK100_005496 [Physocladia obscura]